MFLCDDQQHQIILDVQEGCMNDNFHSNFVVDFVQQHHLATEDPERMIKLPESKPLVPPDQEKTIASVTASKIQCGLHFVLDFDNERGDAAEHTYICCKKMMILKTCFVLSLLSG